MYHTSYSYCSVGNTTWPWGGSLWGNDPALQGRGGSQFTRDCRDPIVNTEVLRSPKRTQADTFRPSRFQIDLVPDQKIAASASLSCLQLDDGPEPSTSRHTFQTRGPFLFPNCPTVSTCPR